MSARYLTYFIPPELDGRSVDVLLRQTLSLSGTAVKRAKRTEGGLLLDGVSVTVRCPTRAGQTLSVLVGDGETEGHVVPTPGPLDLVYEDEDLLVLNKAPGLAVHPGPNHYTDTLGNYVAFYYKKSGLNALFRPVNRLDRGTSGLMVVAKHAHAQERLKMQLHTPDFRRTYLAVCQGTPSPTVGTVDAPIGRVEGSLLQREVRSDGAPARTTYSVLKVGNGRSLVRLELETGRTHQIRVHMAYLGCPLTGDFLYGIEEPSLLSRTALHSAQLALLHPVTGVSLRWEVPLPQDMAGLV